MGHSLVERLVEIWKRVLNRSSVGQDQNFFELGGNAEAAIALFTAISNELKRDLPPLTIFQAPTPCLLASVLSASKVTPFPTAVVMKEGGDGPPVFVTHGIGGNILELLELATNINIPGRVYGLQASGFDGETEPLSRVDDLATVFVEAIRKIQAHGPYSLVGYSFGSLVVFEIARQLLSAGEEIGLLAMLEGYPHRSQLQFGLRAKLYPAVAARHWSILGMLSWRKKFLYLTRASERSPWGSRNEDGSQQRQAPHGWMFAPGLERFRELQANAWISYRPARLAGGKILYIKATQRSILFSDDPGAVWAYLVDDFELRTALGDHFGIITTHAKETAAILAARLNSDSTSR